ncbi:DNA methylase N-4/N-6 [Thalassomonas viridans]|uniref:DNA methylase N-4/N-6 n=2 Tax=Thalassomonas viridans TaxID=137584 RepID=A0AAF0C603_9GAMM|nr:DNA methylase N-4/N-6 [Thalassomonas viridans]
MFGLGKSMEQFIGKQDMTVPLSTAQGVKEVPFQRWFNFKEAFSPKFVIDSIKKTPIKVNQILDPFGGSGTTSLTAQLLGIKPSTIEVNPFIADLIQSKLQTYNLDSLISDWLEVVKSVDSQAINLELLYSNGPSTLYKRPCTERWLFDESVLSRITQYRLSIESLENETNKCLLRVLLGAVLIPLSNVVISGKGRRYRKNWQSRIVLKRDVDKLLETKVNDAIFDISKYSNRKEQEFHLYRGDARERFKELETSDLVLFSPPYPNTFDYTDIYNVELWVLGYLNTSNDNKELRQSTLRSHVQTKLEIVSPPVSDTLSATLNKLDSVRHQLWNKNIPDMVGSYFRDIESILIESHRVLTPGGMVGIVIGDSRYANIKIDTARITKEITDNIGLVFKEETTIRVMKSSAQQGWAKDLDETALYFIKE